MIKIDIQKYRNNKYIEITLIVVLALIAILTVNHSIRVMRTDGVSPEWTRQMELIVQKNDEIIDKTKNEMESDLQNLSSSSLTNRKAEELDALSQGDYVILKKSDDAVHSLKSLYFTNAIIQSKKLGNKQAGLSYINEYKNMVEHHKFVHNYDKLIKEIDDTNKVVLKDDVK